MCQEIFSEGGRPEQQPARLTSKTFMKKGTVNCGGGEWTLNSQRMQAFYVMKLQHLTC
jgi:hypothetical protein